MNLPKVGETILVADCIGDVPDFAIFIAYDPDADYPWICASNSANDHHLTTFKVSRWGYAYERREP